MKQQQSNKAQRLVAAAAILVAAVVLSACGGDGGSVEPSITMVEGQAYQIGENSSMVATSIPPPVIEVVHDFDTNIRSVTMLSGTAELYGDYVLVP